MYTISKQFEFSASHQLNGLPDDHPCSRLHGHNYIVEIVLESAKLNEVGFVRDYRELKIVKDFLDQNFDHRHLNDVIAAQPSAEQIAYFLYHQFKIHVPELAAVRVSETPKTWAEYRR
jgi:6-pyruvoyltetrahydropterin/6-carboxytetrahydropterin synthase